MNPKAQQWSKNSALEALGAALHMYQSGDKIDADDIEDIALAIERNIASETKMLQAQLEEKDKLMGDFYQDIENALGEYRYGPNVLAYDIKLLAATAKAYQLMSERLQDELDNASSLARDQTSMVRKCIKALGWESDDVGVSPWEAIRALREEHARLDEESKSKPIVIDETLLDKMTNEFLRWPLPDTVCSDGCASIPGYKNRVGTNLLSFTEAKQMLRAVVLPHINK